MHLQFEHQYSHVHYMVGNSGEGFLTVHRFANICLSSDYHNDELGSWVAVTGVSLFACVGTKPGRVTKSSSQVAKIGHGSQTLLQTI